MNPLSYYFKLALVILIAALIGYCYYLYSSLETSKRTIVELNLKIEQQNTAVLNLKKDAAERVKKSSIELAKVKTEANKIKERANEIYKRTPAGDECKAALDLGNEQ